MENAEKFGRRCVICAGAKAGERRNLKPFLEVFGEMKVATAVLVIAAVVFMFSIYKVVAAHFREKYRLEMEKEEQMKGILEQVKMYPKWREQSIERQKEFTKAIDKLQQNQAEITRELKEIEERRKKTKRNELRDRLLQTYRYFTNKEKNPLLAWSEMEAEAFWKVFNDYEEAGGDGDMHTTVQPAMRRLEVVPMHEQERVSALMQSRR